MTVFSFDSAEAKKSAGTYLNEIGSAKVCGDKMCDAPLSIAEKITEFLDGKKTYLLALGALVAGVFKFFVPEAPIE